MFRAAAVGKASRVGRLLPLALVIAPTSCREKTPARPSGEAVVNAQQLLAPWTPRATSSTPDPQAEDPFSRCVPQVRSVYLPWPDGETRLVLQAWNGDFSHKGEHAIDVVQALGAPVLAADDGIVTQVIDGFADVGGTEDNVYQANYVEIDHGGGRFSRYLHLQKSTIRVHEGERVARGTRLGSTGNSGFSTLPHVHFSVVDVYGNSVPACLEGVAGGVPRRGFATSTNTETASAPSPGPDIRSSSIPRDAFRDRGVMLFSELPARRWTAGAHLHVRARVATPGASAAVSLAPRDSNLRVGVGTTFESDPRGHVTLDIVLPTKDGRYQLQLGEERSRDEESRDERPRSVPIVLRAHAQSSASSEPPTPDDPDGLWQDAYPGGGRAEAGSYDHGVPIGKWAGWYENGVRKYEGGFVAGKLNGRWTVWYSSGTKRWERDYERGVPTGTWREWSPDGTLVYVGEYALVGGTGAYVERFEDGTTRQQGRYRNGAKDGEWTRWHANGVIAETTSYRHGLKDGPERAWHENGRPKLERTFRAGQPEGRSREWFESGKLSTEQLYRSGKLEGVALRWFENGQKQFAMTFANGMLDGPMTVWNEQGKVVASSEYRAGVQLRATVSSAVPAAK